MRKGARGFGGKKHAYGGACGACGDPQIVTWIMRGESGTSLNVLDVLDVLEGPWPFPKRINRTENMPTGYSPFSFWRLFGRGIIQYREITAGTYFGKCLRFPREIATTISPR